MVGTLGARIVLVDDKEVRAVMTASWLRRMGWKDVFVLVEAGGETGWPDNAVLGAEPTPELRIDCAELAALLAREGATVIDLSTSRSYHAAHIPGAWFAIRSRLAQGLARIPLRGTLVLTSEDGVLAGMAAPEARALTTLPVSYLAAGNAEWCQRDMRYRPMAPGWRTNRWIFGSSPTNSKATLSPRWLNILAGRLTCCLAWSETAISISSALDSGHASARGRIWQSRQAAAVRWPARHAGLPSQSYGDLVTTKRLRGPLYLPDHGGPSPHGVFFANPPSCAERMIWMRFSVFCARAIPAPYEELLRRAKRLLFKKWIELGALRPHLRCVASPTPAPGARRRCLPRGRNSS